MPSPLSFLLSSFIPLLLIPLSPTLAYPFHPTSRSDTCVAASLTSCPSSLPSYFCCPTNHSCFSLAGATTALCCPVGATCRRIMPITCDISLQDPAMNMSAMVKTTLLGAQLPKCGEACCPFGYACDLAEGEAVCQMSADQGKRPDVEGGSEDGVNGDGDGKTSMSTVTTIVSRTSTTMVQPETTMTPSTSVVPTSIPYTTSTPSSSTTPLTIPLTAPPSTSSLRSVPTNNSTIPVPPSSSSTSTTSVFLTHITSTTASASPSLSTTLNPPSTPTGKIIGGVTGAISGVVILALLALFLRRRRHPRPLSIGALPPGHPPTIISPSPKSNNPLSSSSLHTRVPSKTSISSPIPKKGTAPLRTDFILRRHPEDEGITEANSPRYEAHLPHLRGGASFDSEDSILVHSQDMMDSGHGNNSQTTGLYFPAGPLGPRPLPPSGPSVSYSTAGPSSTIPSSHVPSTSPLTPAPLNISAPSYTPSPNRAYLNTNIPPGDRFSGAYPTIRLVDQKVAVQRPSLTEMHPGLGEPEQGVLEVYPDQDVRRDTTISFMMREAGGNVGGYQRY